MILIYQSYVRKVIVTFDIAILKMWFKETIYKHKFTHCVSAILGLFNSIFLF